MSADPADRLGSQWGYWLGRQFIVLPTCTLAGRGEPPFEVTRPDGKVLAVAVRPACIRCGDVLGATWDRPEPCTDAVCMTELRAR